MGHQQLEHKPVEAKPTEVKLVTSKTSSPVSTPSPRGSLAGDEPSGCSTCSSSGLDLEFTRKCTVSADSLLLHPEITSISRSEAASQNKKPKTSEFLRPDAFQRPKISMSMSSDQIHQHSKSSEEEKDRKEKRKSLHLPRSREQNAASSNTKADISRRKESVTNIVFSGTGRIARLLRRTHSAGCSKDVPSHALFLREKPIKKQQKSAVETDVSDFGVSTQRKKFKKHQIALEDMKQRLRFLRRRHTDSSLEQASSVRPNPEEVEKWSQSFFNLMKNK
ncbi:regulator of G-protein signaling 12-like protein, partial [Dinothrombium tinctorium]